MVFFTVFNQVIVLFMLIGIGYVLAKAGIMDDKGSDQLTFILCYIVCPSIILYAFQIKFEPEKLTNLVIVTAAGIGIHFFNIAVTTLCYNKRTVKNEDARVSARFAGTYSNCGFMGFPLLQALAGSTGLFYGTAYNGVFNLFCWTHGFMLHSGRVDKKSVGKALLNPNLIAVLVGVLLFRYSIALPSPLYSAVEYVAQLNTPVSMIVIGVAITRIPIKELFSSGFALFAALMRNLLLPLPLLFLLHFAGLSGDVLLCCVVLAASPSAGMTVIFAKLTGRDVILPGKMMTISTLLSLVTLPVIVTLIKALGY